MENDKTEARMIIANEGIGYAVRYYCGPDHFEDPKLKELWAKAQEALDALESYVGE